MFSDQLAWIFQESPCVYISLYYTFRFICSDSFTFNSFNTFKIFLIALFVGHYIHRSFIYPFKLKIDKTDRKFPIEISMLAFSFCIVNSILQNRSIFYFSDYKSYENETFAIFVSENFLR